MAILCYKKRYLDNTHWIITAITKKWTEILVDLPHSRITMFQLSVHYLKKSVIPCELAGNIKVNARIIPYFFLSPSPNFGRWRRRDFGNLRSAGAREPWPRQPLRACPAAAPATPPPSSAARASSPPDRGYSPYSAPPGAGETLTHPLPLQIYLKTWN